MLTKNNMLLYAVTDRSWLNGRTLEECVEQALIGGATFIQLREKNTDTDEFIQTAKNIKQLTDKYNVPFVINDRVDIALAVNADGVHVGQNDMTPNEARKLLGADKIVGVSAHNVDEAVKAQENGADYIGVGAVFSTSTKKDATALDRNQIALICDAVDIPVVLIGGLNENNIPTLTGCGADGAAVVSAIFAKDDIVSATKQLKAVCKNAFGA